MSGLKDTFKNGWHPKGKDGKGESWRGDFKGINQIAGKFGKGKDSSKTAEGDHIARPLHTLKDPSAFGPPPKNVNYHGGAAIPNRITPDTRGLGAPLSREEIAAKERAKAENEQREAEEAEAEREKPPVPYRVNTSGLTTSHLPPPPGRKDGADGRSPIVLPSPVSGSRSKPPSLPPRLPPRQNSTPTSPPPRYAITEPEPHKGILNEGAIGRLGAAGLSVPGFGIEGRKPSLPPPSSFSTKVPTSTQPNNASQLDELQNRFSRLTPSASPKPTAPSEGTTFAQKQAALKTASSFRNDPSSVSLGDVKSAANTANNFRERHGEQVKTGWQAANKLNNKYGVIDKVGSYGGMEKSPPEPETESAVIISPETAATLSQSGALGKKKPPPPPVKKPTLSVGSPQSATPPPIPLATKPKPQPITQSTQSLSEHDDLPLDLPSLWFAKQPPAWPPSSINHLPGDRSTAYNIGWSSSGPRKTYTFIGAVRDNVTFATTIIHMTWDSSNPGYTVKGQQKHLPPPHPLSLTELEKFRKKYGEVLAEWSEDKVGQQVGNGECWTLAADGLAAVGALRSQSFTHGSLLYSFLPEKSPQPSPPGGIIAAGVSRGDVVQLYEARFRAKDGSEQWAGMPHHTAIVVKVEPTGKLIVLEQNIGGVLKVQYGKYDFTDMRKGEVRIYRPVSEQWVGKLEPKW